MARRGRNSSNIIPLQIRRRVRRILSRRFLILLLLGSTLVLGTYFKRTEQPHSAGGRGLLQPLQDRSERTLPRVLRGGNAMQRAGKAQAGLPVTTNGPESGRVTHVRDGDTIEVTGRPIRLDKLDCAETGSVAGEAATRRMRALVSGQRVTCTLTGERSYDRWIGSCQLADGRDIAGVMIGERLCRRLR